MVRCSTAVRLLVLGISCLSIVLAEAPTQVLSQGILIDEAASTTGHWHLPRPRPIISAAPIRSYAISELSVQASVQNQVAVTLVSQTFRNTGSQPIEGRFIFPLPYEGAIDQVTFLVDGKEIEAKLFTAEEASRIYQGYLQKNQDPALVQWMGTGLFQTSVFPLPVGGSRTVTLKYTQLLRREGNLTDYLFPLATARYTSLPIEKLQFRVALAETEEIKNVYSPTHEVEVKREDGKNVVVSGQWTNIVPNSDLRLVYDMAVGPLTVNVLSTWPADAEEGYFVLMGRPTFDLTAAPPQRKNVLFVVDQSGSMSGEKIQQAQDAAKFVLGNLRPNDRFGILSYHNSVQAVASSLLDFNDETRSQALGFINGIQSGGMTNIEAALIQGFSMIPADEDPSYLVFLTDGLPTVGEKNEMKIAETCRRLNVSKARVVVFGVGYDVNSRLLDRLARDHRGQSEYILPSENLEAAVARLYSKISTPIVTNMKIRFQSDVHVLEDGPLVDRIYPRDHSELYAGSQLVLFGRYRQGGKTQIRVSGKVGDQEQEFAFELDLAKRGENARFPFVSKLWAMRRIGELIDEIDLVGKNSELVDELVALSLRHGILTPYTSYLADENSVPLADVSQQRELTLQGLQALGEVSGEAGVSGRSFKQSNKRAENLMGLEARNSSQSLRGPGPGVGLGGAGSSVPAVPPIGGLASGTPLVPRGGRNAQQAAELASGNGQNQGSLIGLRSVGQWSLYKRGELLIADNAVDVDLEKQSSDIRVIDRFSPEWQALVAANNAAENLLLADQQPGEELLVRLRDVIYRIR